MRCLAWDVDRNLLFSGSFDQSIIVWDIGGQQGTAFELQGHRDKVQTLAYAATSRQLLSSGDEGIVTIWDMNVKRQEVPIFINLCIVYISNYEIVCLWLVKHDLI